jgi:hypothetical protein
MALLERSRQDVSSTPPPDGGQRPKRGSLMLRSYSSAVIRLTAAADRLQAYRNAANDPAVDDKRRRIKAGLFLGAAGGAVVLGATAEALKAKFNTPALSDVFSGGSVGGSVADCVNDATKAAPQPKDGMPHPQPGIPVDVFDACVAKVQQASQNGK